MDKLCYLNARYYNPEWRRSIFPDDTAYIDSETPNGLSLYCYCNNDPINYADPSGYSLLLILGLIGCVGVVIIGAIVEVIYATARVIEITVNRIIR